MNLVRTNLKSSLHNAYFACLRILSKATEDLLKHSQVCKHRAQINPDYHNDQSETGLDLKSLNLKQGSKFSHLAITVRQEASL